MKSLRALALAAVVAGTALVPAALPAQAAPAKHTVTVMITSVEVTKDFDAQVSTGCGDFSFFGMKNDDTGQVTNVIPTGAEVDYWSTAAGWRATFGLCDSAPAYPVAQTNLPELAASYAKWSNLGLTADPKISATNINRTHFSAVPGSTSTFSGLGVEYDGWPFPSWNSAKAPIKVAVPAAGKTKAFMLPIDFIDPYSIIPQRQTGIILHGVIITAA